MALLIAYYLIIQLLQMERIYKFRMLYWTWCTNICKIYIFQSPIYMKALLLKHQYYIQLLSFEKNGLYIYNWGFNTNEIICSSLLNNPLLSWDSILDKEYFMMMLYIFWVQLC
jgi:hypothetical protein